MTDPEPSISTSTSGILLRGGSLGASFAASPVLFDKLFLSRTHLDSFGRFQIGHFLPLALSLIEFPGAVYKSKFAFVEEAGYIVFHPLSQFIHG
jgi:hypothetical protein